MEIITNGNFDHGDDGAGWTFTSSCEVVNDKAISHSPPNCLAIGARGPGYADQFLSTEGVLYYADSGKLNFWVKNRSHHEASLVVTVYYTDVAPWQERNFHEYHSFEPGSSQWHKVKIALNREYPLRAISFTAFGSFLIDDVSIDGSRVYLFVLFRYMMRIYNWLIRVFYR